LKNIPVGLDQLHYAIMDDEDLETYEAPVAIPGTIMANIVPTTNAATLYADDKAWDVAMSLGDIALVLNVADIPTADRAAWLGHTVDANGVLVRKDTDHAPYVAIGFRRKMSNGKYRYVWLLKGKFRAEEQNANTKTDTPTFQTPTINATFMPRDTDRQWQSVVNEGDPGVETATLTSWFDSVYLSSADAVAPTVAVVPLDEAIDVAASTDVVWTFSEAIKASTINGANFMLLDSDLAPVAGTLDYNVGATIVTFTPTAPLTAAQTYTAIVTTGVKDLAGNALAAPSITTFTIAA
jgi:phi13 family phage major tail protein